MYVIYKQKYFYLNLYIITHDMSSLLNKEVNAYNRCIKIMIFETKVKPFLFKFKKK